MNHEIRTPLIAMRGFTALLDGEVDSVRGRRSLSAISRSGEALAELINDILDLSKIESGMLDLEEEPFLIQSFAKGLELLFEGEAKSGDLQLILKVDLDRPEVVTADRMRLRQILINLVGNAFKFTEEGSITVRFGVRKVAPGDGSCTLLIAVTDTGCGIAPDRQEAIFKPFQQAKVSDEMKGGTGLGLSISRELTALMGGLLELESTPGKGSAFRIILPDIPTGGSAPAPVEAQEADFNRLTPSRILVVDDNAYNRDLMEGFFEGTHHEFAFARNGMQALEAMWETAFDLVLVDIRMPVMDGREARGEILEDPALQETPVIAATASSLLKEEKRLRRIFDGYLRKPFTGAKLFATVQEVVGSVRDEDPEVPPPAVLAPEESLPEEPSGLKGSSPALQKSAREIQERTWESLTSAMVFGEVRAVDEELQVLGEA